MRRHLLGLMAGLVLAAMAGNGHAEPWPAGSSIVPIARAAPGGETVRAFIYKPAAFGADDPILFVMHGVQRNADVYRDNWIAEAEARRVLVIVPEMSQALFPREAGYNFGSMVDRAGVWQPTERWAWQVIETIFDAARAGTGSRRQTYALFGHSAGAQFVHRFVMFAPAARYDIAISANAGWYTMPTFEVAFPYGLGTSPLDDKGLMAALQKPVIILLGEADTDPAHPSLRRDAGADAQGLHRFARGQAFFAQASAQAKRRGVSFGWRLETVPGVAHDNAGMAASAARLMFGAR
jgi:poly(3-hydroxybutyrate) depolymerase